MFLNTFNKERKNSKSVQIYMKDAERSETNEKINFEIFPILFFELTVIFVFKIWSFYDEFLRSFQNYSQLFGPKNSPEFSKQKNRHETIKDKTDTFMSCLKKHKHFLGLYCLYFILYCLYFIVLSVCLGMTQNHMPRSATVK